MKQFVLGFIRTLRQHFLYLQILCVKKKHVVKIYRYRNISCKLFLRNQNEIGMTSLVSRDCVAFAQYFQIYSSYMLYIHVYQINFNDIREIKDKFFSCISNRSIKISLETQEIRQQTAVHVHLLQFSNHARSNRCNLCKHSQYCAVMFMSRHMELSLVLMDYLRPFVLFISCVRQFLISVALV